MDYGIGIPSYIDAWREVQAAEAAGFTHAWFYDSQLIYSDVYATMALAAQTTSRIKLGTLVAIPTNRIAHCDDQQVGPWPGHIGYGDRLYWSQYHGATSDVGKKFKGIYRAGPRAFAGRRCAL